VNIYGDGPLSSTPLSFVPSDIPDEVDIVSVGLSGTDVWINWNAPDDHNEAITEYDILILKSDASYASHANCDGTDGTVISNTECFIPMVEIPALTSLATDELIQAVVRAKNANGWGAYSQVNIAG